MHLICASHLPNNRLVYALKLSDHVLVVEDEVADRIHVAIAERRQFVERLPLDLGTATEPHVVTLNLAEVRSLTRINDAWVRPVTHLRQA